VNGILEMFPAMPISDLADGIRVHAESFAQYDVCALTHSDRQDVSLGQFVDSFDAFGVAGPALGRLVSHIVERRAVPEMRRIAARRIVAGVATQPWPSAVSEKEGNPVSVDCRAWQAKFAIPSRQSAGSPRPTLIGFSASNLRPEANDSLTVQLIGNHLMIHAAKASKECAL